MHAPMSRILSFKLKILFESSLGCCTCAFELNFLVDTIYTVTHYCSEFVASIIFKSAKFGSDSIIVILSFNDSATP